MIDNSQFNPPFPHSELNQESPHPERYLPLPTAETLKNTSLFGIPLRSALTNQEMSDATLEDYITKSISQLEHELNIFITPVQFEERHDYIRKLFQNSYAFLKLNNSPVLDVQQVRLSFSNQQDPQPAFIEFPLEHVYVDPQEGGIRLVPAYGTSVSGFLLSAFAGAQMHALIAAGLDIFPGAVRVRYRAGFDKDKVPAVIVGIIEKQAALFALTTIAPLIFPYNSVSIGIDGVSQGVGTMGPNFLQARIQELRQQIQEEKEAAKTYYLRRTLVDFI
jgi:hypothetical protein